MAGKSQYTIVNLRGEVMTLQETIKATGNLVSLDCAKGRLRSGQPLLRALTAPPANRKINRWDGIRPLAPENDHV